MSMPEVERPRRSTFAVLALFAGGAVILALIFLPYRIKSLLNASAAAANPAAKAGRQLAVLPFRLMDEEGGDKVLRDGILETLTHQMSRLEEGEGRFSVIPSSLVRDLSVVDAAAAKKTLGADLVLEGGLQSLESGWRATLYLVDGQTGGILLTRTVDGRTAELGAFQNQIAETALAMLDPGFPF